MRPNRIKKTDYARVLVTETLPFETPLIFSNDGLYKLVVGISRANPQQQKLLGTLILGKEKNDIHSTIPYLYKVRKNSAELRRLALIHPRSQWKVKEFYERYENLILFHCKHSPASIRAPVKVAGSFYFKSSIENLNRYKTGTISVLALDDLTKHSPSYFAYKSYDRLYRFFESRDYFELEKKYAHMCTLDVTKCFDSIYTHCMSWAIKDKEFTKKNIKAEATFAQEFDKLMRYANHGETNGIVIGPEVSRVFSEIIFQEIDCQSINRIKERLGYQFSEQYEFRRYVDDVFIFAETKGIAEEVYKCYSDVLLSYNLHANSLKNTGLTRPFVTNKSRLIQEANREVNKFVEKFLKTSNSADTLEPLPVRSTWRLTRSFIEAVKTLCSYNQANYDEISGYLIAVLAERVKKLVAIDAINDPDEVATKYLNANLVLLDLLYFLYQVSPSVSASYKLSTAVILAVRFTRKHFPLQLHTISQRIFELTESLLVEERESEKQTADNFLPLEVLNIVLATTELGENYRLSEKTLEKLFSSHGQSSYFGIVSCLFYIRDDPRYRSLHRLILTEVDKKLSDLSDIRMNSEKAFLLLDMLACPYADIKRKNRWLRSAFKGLGLGDLSKPEAAAFLTAAQAAPVHINWHDVDLLNTLERKELKRVY